MTSPARTPRVGDQANLPGRRSTAADSLGARVSSALASPLGILAVVPGLVLAVGVLLTLIGQRALENSALALGHEQFRARTLAVSHEIKLGLAQADPMLDRLRTLALTHSPADSFEQTAFSLRDLIQGRPGVAYVSLSYPDGTFQGAYLHEDGSIRFQDSRVEGASTRVRRYGTDGRDGLQPLVEERSDYDPRTREFYRLAVQASGPVWTKPYTFWKTFYTGVTRTAAVRRGGPESPLVGVVTVDFDVNAMSRYLQQIPLPGARVILYTEDGTLLGDPASASRLSRMNLRRERPLRYADLRDPLLNAFFQAQHEGGDFRFREGRERYLFARTDIDYAGLDWRVGAWVPERAFLEPARAYQRRGGLLALVALSLSVLVAVLFSRHAVRIRREAAEARAEASRERERARELGSYRLVSLLGKGGMGEVWRAEHRLLAREAAIKLIKKDVGGLQVEEARERFRREAQTLAALRSRNTIELFDYGVTSDGTFFYVMELLDGMDLETLVQRYGPQPPARVRSLLIQVCNSLAEAHAAGLVHRDVKPANLFICRAATEVDIVKVLDFGLVRAFGDALEGPGSASRLAELERSARRLESGEQGLTRAGELLGTPEFMAPEQVLSERVEGRADLYALGCVGYYLLSGRTPFQRHTQALPLMLAHVREEPQPIGELVEGLPEPFERAIMRCLEKDQSRRFQTAEEMAAALAAATFSEPQSFSAEAARAWWAAHVPRRSQSMLPPEDALVLERSA